MAQSSACCSFCQNPQDGKDELDGGTPTKGSDRCTSTPTATFTPTPVVALVIILLVAFGSADSSAVRYLKDDLQQILRTVLDFRLLVPVPAPVVAAAPHHEGSYEQPLKAWFLDIYQSKTHLECYNFFQKCTYHFATAGAMGPNRVPFAATFLKNTAPFY